MADKQVYFQSFVDYLDSLKINSLTMTVEEIREKLGKDEKGEYVLCDTPFNHATFWGYNNHHRFPFYLGNHGWKCLAQYTNNQKLVTFEKK